MLTNCGIDRLVLNAGSKKKAKEKKEKEKEKRGWFGGAGHSQENHAAPAAATKAEA